jgi:hypothetical protein
MRTDPAPPCNRGNSKKACRDAIEIRHGYGIELGLELTYGAAGAAPVVTQYGPTAMDELTLRAGGYITGP